MRYRSRVQRAGGGGCRGRAGVGFGGGGGAGRGSTLLLSAVVDLSLGGHPGYTQPYEACSRALTLRTHGVPFKLTTLLLRGRWVLTRLPCPLMQAVAAGGEDKAADLWRSSGLDASKFFEMPEDLEGLSAKYAFLAA